MIAGVPPAALRYTILAAFYWTRQQEILDTLAELLIDTVHHLKTRAEGRVNKSFLADIRRVSGKNELLVKISAAALVKPEGILQQVLYPVAGEETLRAIVKEHEAGGLAYQQKIYAARRGSYRAHYRQGLPAVLKVLTFHASQKADSALLDALERLQQYTAVSSPQVHFADDEVMPLDNVIPEAWHDFVVNAEARRGRQTSDQAHRLRTQRVAHPARKIALQRFVDETITRRVGDERYLR